MKKYNILWIFSDQHREQALGAAGDPNAITPNLDALAQDGIFFSNTYTLSPLCSPARATYYTGKYIHQHGVVSLHRPPRHDLKMLPEMLKEQGYHTIHIGKWHLSGGAAPGHFVSPYFRPGWDQWMGWENYNRFFETRYTEGTRPHSRLLEGYQTDGATDLAIRCLEERKNSEQPWFLVLSVEPPHTPHIAPEEDQKIYENREIQYRENVPDSWKTPENEKKIKGYYAQILNLDRNIGRLTEKLKETGQYDNTIIMYFSDHGDFVGSLGKEDKTYAENESSKIPFIVRHPEMKKRGIQCSEIVSGLDIPKTTLAFAGCPEDSGIYGTDLSDLILTGSGSTKGWALIELNSQFCDDSTDKFYRALVSEDYLYVKGKEPQLCKLYDLQKDPYQMHNVLHDPSYRQAAAQMHEKLMGILQDIGDLIYLEWE